MANAEPEVVIQSAAMRSGTTYLDVHFRVNDADDATVKTRALAFVDGERSFENILRPLTYVEGTEVNIGDSVPSNTDLILTWDVAADWDVDLGQLKFEVLAQDDRGLLPLDWITIPATQSSSELTISTNIPNYASALDALFWLYASGDTELQLIDGFLTVSPGNSQFADQPLSLGDQVLLPAYAYLYDKMDVSLASLSEVLFADYARSGIDELPIQHALNQPAQVFEHIRPLSDFSANSVNTNLVVNAPGGLFGIQKLVANASGMAALLEDGTAIVWGESFTLYKAFGDSGEELTYALDGYDGYVFKAYVFRDVIDVSSSNEGIAVLKDNGDFTFFGVPMFSENDLTESLENVSQISIHEEYLLALREDGSVAMYAPSYVQLQAPPAITNATKVLAIDFRSALAIVNGGIVLWGDYSSSREPPSGLGAVKDVQVSNRITMALLEDGTVEVWGSNSYNQLNVPANLSNVKAISIVDNACYALQEDGSVVAWGSSFYNPANLPPLDNLFGAYGVTKP